MLDQSHEFHDSMLLDDPLWVQFRQAKASFFGALDRTHPPTVHILSAPPSQRPTMRTKTDKYISSLLEAECELEALHHEVKRGQKTLSQRRGAAEMFRQTIGMLSSEVVREIVLTPSCPIADGVRVSE